MLRNVKDLRGFALLATDGVIGKEDDLYFDDADWGVRSLVVNTGSWLSNRDGATDGEIGHLEDLLIDDHTWAIRYLIVNTSNWWSGHRVLLSPDCIRDVSWSEAKVSIGLTRQDVSDSPLYESMAQLESTREQGAPSGPAPQMRAGER